MRGTACLVASKADDRSEGQVEGMRLGVRFYLYVGHLQVPFIQYFIQQFTL